MRWKYERDDDGGYPRIVDEAGLPICSWAVNGRGMNIIPHAAHGELMAIAPRMLEVCGLVIGGGRNHSGESAWRMAMGIVEELEAAKETREIMADPNLMVAIKASEDDIKAGRVEPFETNNGSGDTA